MEKAVTSLRGTLFSMLRAETAKVYESLFPVLYRIAYRITGQRDKAEDICQEAFIKYFERGEPLPDLDQTKYWLIRVLRNLALNYEKKRIRENRAYQRLMRAAPQFSESGESAVLAEETRGLVQHCLDQLPYNLRIVLVLKEYTGLGYKEIAKVLGIREGNVKIRVFRARERLSRLLDGRLS